MSWAPPPQGQQYGYGAHPPGAPPPAGYAGTPGYGSAPPGGTPGYGAPPAGSGATPSYAAPPPGYGAPPPGGAPPAMENRPPPTAPGYQASPASARPPQSYGQPAGHAGVPPPGSGYPPTGGAPAGYAGGYHATPGYGQPAPPPGINPELWGWFQAVDTDRSGKITCTELQQALMNGNWSPFNSETCRLMIGMFDRDRSGTIDVHEFAALWKYIQDWRSCFDRFDTDRSGNINALELNNAFRTFGYNLSQGFCQLCVRVFDRRSTSTMNFDDFIQCCVMLKTLTDKFREKDRQQRGTIQIQYEEFLQMVLDNSLSL